MATKLYRFRLESGDGEFRTGAIAAESRDEAKAILEQREQEAAAYRLDTDELAEAEQDPTSASSRSRLALHNQAAPYKLKKLEEAK